MYEARRWNARQKQRGGHVWRLQVSLQDFALPLLRIMKGRDLSGWTVSRCLELLRQTDLSIPAIAIRLGISGAAVRNINRDAHIRLYRGRRRSFAINGENHHVA